MVVDFFFFLCVSFFFSLSLSTNTCFPLLWRIPVLVDMRVLVSGLKSLKAHAASRNALASTVNGSRQHNSGNKQTNKQVNAAVSESERGCSAKVSRELAPRASLGLYDGRTVWRTCRFVFYFLTTSEPSPGRRERVARDDWHLAGGALGTFSRGEKETFFWGGGAGEFWKDRHTVLFFGFFCLFRGSAVANQFLL